LRKMLAKQPEQRYQTPADLVQAIDAICGPGPAKAVAATGPFSRKRRRVLLVAGIALMLFLGTCWLLSGPTDSLKGRSLGTGVVLEQLPEGVDFKNLTVEAWIKTGPGAYRCIVTVAADSWYTLMIGDQRMRPGLSFPMSPTDPNVLGYWEPV